MYYSAMKFGWVTGPMFDAMHYAPGMECLRALVDRWRRALFPFIGGAYFTNPNITRYVLLPAPASRASAPRVHLSPWNQHHLIPPYLPCASLSSS